jgi:hypothetical protein
MIFLRGAIFVFLTSIGLVTGQNRILEWWSPVGLAKNDKGKRYTDEDSNKTTKKPIPDIVFTTRSNALGGSETRQFTILATNKDRGGVSGTRGKVSELKITGVSKLSFLKGGDWGARRFAFDNDVWVYAHEWEGTHRRHKSSRDGYYHTNMNKLHLTFPDPGVGKTAKWRVSFKVDGKFNSLHGLVKREGNSPGPDPGSGSGPKGTDVLVMSAITGKHYKRSAHLKNGGSDLRKLLRRLRK